jgi:type IV pilus assembly protein PilX
MNNQAMDKHPNSKKVMLRSHPAHQSGVVLIVSLIMLLLLTLIGATGMQNTALEEKMAGNMRDKNLAFQAAESALKDAETSLAVLPTFSIAGTGGYYSQAASNSGNILAPDASPKITDDSFWTSQPTHTSSVTTLGNGISTPVYIIQEIGGVADCAGAAVGSGGCKNYRITARATGGSTSAVVILQSIYLR